MVSNTTEPLTESDWEVIEQLLGELFLEGMDG